MTELQFFITAQNDVEQKGNEMLMIQVRKGEREGGIVVKGVNRMVMDGHQTRW